ncbi:MAG: hypothetical protein WCO33_02430 [bacterium]
MVSPDNSGSVQQDTAPLSPITASSSKEVSVPWDIKWYDRFVKVGSFQAYEYFEGGTERSTQRTEFITNDQIQAPDLKYPKLKLDELNARSTELRALKEEIQTQEENYVVRLTYQWKINEKLAEVEMLKTTLAMKNPSNTPEEKARLERNFRKYTEFIYGKPDKATFDTVVNQVRAKFEDIIAKEPETSTMRKYAIEALRTLPNNANPEVRAIAYNDRALDLLKVDTDKRLNALYDSSKLGDDPYKEVSSDLIVEVFTEALANLHADGWKVITPKDGRSNVSVDQENKLVKVPEDSVRKYTVKDLRSLLAHEIVTHVANRTNGEKGIPGINARMLILGVGADRYEAGEEGVAVGREASLDKSKIEITDGYEGYIAIGLAYGLDGEGKQRNFREVYESIKAMFIVDEFIDNKKKQEQNQKSDEACINDGLKYAFNRCVRSFRGTNCDAKGIVFTKDIIYRDGTIRVFDVINENSGEIIRFSIGKHDPSNARHWWILSEMGITEEALRSLSQN